MAEIHYRELEKHLSAKGKSGLPPVFLIHGEEYLYKTAFNTVLDALIPSSQRSFGYEPADEDSESMPDIIERLNTFSMMSGAKVVGLLDSRIFYSRQDQDAAYKKIKAAWDKGDRKKAAIMMGSLISQAQLEPDDALSEKGRDELKYNDSFDDNGAFLAEVMAFIRDSGLSLKKNEDPLKLLKDAIDKGFPDNHHLVITTDIVDKRKSLYTAIRDKGLVVDCSVPKGDRKADKDSQDQVLKEAMASILGKNGKTMDPSAYAFLCEMTGFDIRTFTGNLEKLIAFTGDRTAITLTDARQLLQRSRQDPIYELSGAIAERDLSKALFYTSSLLSNGVFPLQIIATIANQFRRLLVAKDFVLSLPQGKWRSGMDFNSFKTSIMPYIKEYDLKNQKAVEQREARLAESGAGDGSADSGKKGPKKEKKKAETDLILAKNPNSPYPVYLLVVNAGRYSLSELYSAVEMTYKADIRLKSTGEIPKLVLEDLILHVCRTTS